MLDISHKIDIVYYKNLKNFQVVIDNNSKHEIIIKIDKLLVEK